MTETKDILAIENALLKKKILKLEGEVNKYRYDALTGLRLRKDFDESLGDCFSKFRLEEENFYLSIIDVNGLHHINKTEGYLAGDTMIQKVATNIIDNCPEGQLFRIGGDEFAILSHSKPDCINDNDFVFATVVSKEYKTPREMFQGVDKKLKVVKEKFYIRTGKDRRR